LKRVNVNHSNIYTLLYSIKKKGLNYYQYDKIIDKYFNKLIKFFFKNGFLGKQTQTLLSTFSQIFLFFLNKFNKDFKGYGYNNYLNVREFYFLLNNTKQFNNLTNIIQWIVSLNYTQFDIHIQKIPKKYKKKNKKKYTYKIKYLGKGKQIGNVLRWICLTNYNFNTYGFKKRLFLNILDLLLNFKKSNLFSKKIIVYKNFLKL